MTQRTEKKEIKRLSPLKQCCFLNQDGKRCRVRSAIKMRLHLDGELYNYPSWVEVNLCAEHFFHFGGSLRPNKETGN